MEKQPRTEYTRQLCRWIVGLSAADLAPEVTEEVRRPDAGLARVHHWGARVPGGGGAEGLIGSIGRGAAVYLAGRLPENVPAQRCFF